MKELLRRAPRAEESPFALLIADLLEQNVSRAPRKLDLLLRLDLNVILSASDIETSATLQFRGPAGVTVYPGMVDGDGHVAVTGTSDAILDLARLELIGNSGIPVLWKGTGPATLRRIVRQELRLRAGLRDLPRLATLLSLMSVA